MTTDPDLFTDEDQAKFTRDMRERLPKEPGAQFHAPTTLFTDYASRVLGRPVTFWRGLTKTEARQVITHLRKEHPTVLNPERPRKGDDHDHPTP